MAGKDKKADKAAAAEGDAKPKGGGGLMSTLPLAVIAAAGTFGMVWYAATPAAAPVISEDEVAAMCEAKDPVPAEELAARAASYIVLDPITVSLGPDAGAEALRISLALGTSSEMNALSDVQALRLRDRFLERLRTVDQSLLIEPQAMPALKEALLAQAHATLGEDAVYSVLVTDFLVK